MILASNTKEDKLLDQVPDFTDWDKTRRWINKGRKFIQSYSEKAFLESEIYSLEWNSIQEKSEFPFGLYSSKTWQKFVLATFCADIVSYTKRVDQVNFERLLYVMHAYPQGFRIWWTRLSNGTCWPVGYTGFYPMLETTFELFKNHPERLKDRMVVPNTHVTTERPYLYLFNFSVPAQLKKTFLTKILIKSFVEDIQSQNAAGLACITVSEDGIRIANRLDMSYRGDLQIDGSLEGVYVKRFNR